MKKKKCIREYRKQVVIDATAASKTCGPNTAGRCDPKYDATRNAEAKKFCSAKKGLLAKNCRLAFTGGWAALRRFEAAIGR